MSAGFSESLVEAGHTEVTVLLRAPNRLLTGPSDPFQDGRMGPNANWSLTEFPIMRQNSIRVMAMHPGENGRPGIDRYEIWPNDQGHDWQRRWQGGEQQPEELQCGPGENSVLVTCQTAIDESTFEVGCPSVPGSLEPPLAGGQCNYTVEASVNPQVNTFSITNSLTTLAVGLLVTCFSATCGSGANPRPLRSLLSDSTLAHRAAVAEARAVDVMAGY
ncbi:hypothetical protein F5883DRAFT_581501 [Diaporthe sp. PMI_573]|nr:hypothetical protein F5883DRAFT_581501 [Diaporthaceae sp. PMI_573]